MFTVEVDKYNKPVRYSNIKLTDGTNAAGITIFPRVGQVVEVSGLHRYGTRYYPKSLDELPENILSAYEENGFGVSTETIEGETFGNIEEAVSYIQDVVLVEASEVTDYLAADLDKKIADIKRSLKELEDKRKETFLFINKFSGAI